MPTDAKQAQHREIARRYKRAKRRKVSLAALRIRDLNRLFRARYGETLPDDDSGRDDARIMAHHLASLSGDPRRHVLEWFKLRAPWLSLADADKLLIEAIAKPRRWRADRLAWRLRLIEVDRAALGITTIGAIDKGLADRLKRRQERKRAFREAQRRARGARARADYEAQSLSRTQPWKAEGISRRTWERRRKSQRVASPNPA